MDRKTGRTSLALAALFTAVVLSSSIGVGAAHAALPGHCLGTGVTNAGSSLQQPAQLLWEDGFATESGTTAGGCLNKSVVYGGSSSGSCLTDFGVTGEAVVISVSSCGTDLPPSESQITTSNMTTGSKLLTIPVAQAAIAVVVNLPGGCTVDSITPDELEKVFRGGPLITTWSALTAHTEHTANACRATINRVVPADVSGITYQLKHYLTLQTTTAVHAGLTWKDLQSVANNTTWPGTVSKSRTGCTTAMTPANCIGAANSGVGATDEVETVGATASSIGFAPLPAARSVYAENRTTWPNLTWLKLRVVGVSLDPGTGATEPSTTKARSNCTTANGAYVAPTGGATGDWSQVYLANAGTGYPICTLSWDLAVTTYAPTWPDGTGVAQTIKDYVHYVLGAGQSVLSANNDYALLPANIVEVATTGVNEIGG